MTAAAADKTACRRARRSSRSSAATAALLLLSALMMASTAQAAAPSRKLLQGWGNGNQPWNRPGQQGWMQGQGNGNRPAWSQGGGNRPWGGNNQWGQQQPQQQPPAQPGGAGQSSSQSGSQGVTAQPKPVPQPQQPVPQPQQPNPNRNKGDINSLSSLTSPAQGYRGRPRQAIAAPTSGPGASLYPTLRRRGESKAAANALAQTYSSNSEAAATAMASAATSSSGGEASAVAEAVATTTVTHPNIAPGLLAKSADLAVNRGQTDAFASTMADAFGAARRQAIVPQFTRSVADAISQGGPSTRLAYGEAMAQAIAGGGDSQAAVAEATASAFCAGGSTASSWASAFAIALSKDSRGCLVLNEARAQARAQCGPKGAEAASKAEATSLVLGFCGLLDFFPGFNFSNSQGGTNSWSG